MSRPLVDPPYRRPSRLQIAPDRARSHRDRVEIAPRSQRSHRDRAHVTALPDQFDPDFTSGYADMEARNAYRLGHRD